MKTILIFISLVTFVFAEQPISDYRKEPLYPEYLEYRISQYEAQIQTERKEAHNQKEQLKNTITQQNIAIGVLLFLSVFLFFIRKIKPFISESLLSKRRFFRLKIIVSFFWSFGWLMWIKPFRCRGFCNDWQQYLLIGLLPLLLYWSIYWVKKADD
ncbi:hypothetical protein [Sulfurimonas sp.]|uniref:hypothetical protein n=1 Tax=Sulfurimonas sp. TaxID=2022749 RepID=UPI003D09DDFD